jgi:hypothetical protein
MMNEVSQAYPVTVTGELTVPPGRWQWLIKWLLAIPHWIILYFLEIAFFFVWIFAWFAILFTARYPKGLFDFSVGVLRWSWRVSFYSYNALGTDKYPPFSVEPNPDYPADLEVQYPERLSRGLIWVKWWLLAIPHWIIIAVFNDLLPILVIIAGIILLFTGKYQKDIFRLVVGVNRWTYRVAAYASLMRDEYPPFRFWDD